MEKQDKNNRCEYCREIKADVHKVIDLCTWELSGIEEYVLICNECLDMRRNEL